MSYIGNEPIVSATRTITEITATAGQTVFVANGGYTVGYIDVFVNGAQLQTSDFTATNGSSITLVSPATIGDDIRLVAWGTFSTINTYTQAQADALLATKANTTYVDGRLNTTFAFKNRVINGDFRIDQRNNGASVTPTGSAYTLDRWLAGATVASKFSVQQNAGSVTPPNGFTNYLGVTSTSAYSVLASDSFSIQQRIEGFNTADLGFGTANAKPLILSFWVRSSLTGTFGGAIYGNPVRSYPFSYSISTANTWTYITIAIAGDTTVNNYNTTNGFSLIVIFGLGTGSSGSGGVVNTWQNGGFTQPASTVSLVGTNGATFYLTGVQLEVGSSATPFDTRAYGTELALCQRYLPCFDASISFNGTAAPVGAGFTANASLGRVIYTFKVPSRVPPTGITVSSPSSFTYLNGGTASSASAITTSFSSVDCCLIEVTASAAILTSGQGGYMYATVSTAKILFNGCEL